MIVDELKEALTNNQAILLDVREQDEWEDNHLDCAYHFPLSLLCQKNIPSHFPPDKTIYIHCKIGGRAEQAALILQAYYASVIPIRYSFEELKKLLTNKTN